jgi:predicted transcriptional regulator
MIVKKIQEDLYELYQEEKVLDIDENEVIIPKRIGTYSIEELEKEKLEFEEAIEQINYKLNQIKKEEKWITDQK